MNKSKHPKEKGEYKEQNGRTHIQEDQSTTKEAKRTIRTFNVVGRLA
jgi:hypothetical protein